MTSDEQKKQDDRSFGRDGAAANPEKQGISNRPGDEDPDTGVDPAPGPPQVKDPNQRNQ